jgi:hypothetical protein
MAALPEDALARLRDLLGQDEKSLRLFSAIAVLSQGGDDERAVHTCLRALGPGPLFPFRVEAVTALGLAGPKTSVAIPLLVSLASGADGLDVTFGTANVVGSTEVLRAALDALVARSPEARWAAEPLAEVLRTKHDVYLASAVARLGGPSATEGLPELLPWVREARGATGSTSAELRAVIAGLEALGPAAAAARDDLAALIAVPDAEGRAAVLRALGAMGPAASSAIERVEDREEDDDPAVRAAAADAARRIRGR